MAVPGYGDGMSTLRIYDNGGKSFDRYTILPPRWAREYYSRRSHLWSALASSDDPFHPQGFGQHVSAMAGKHLGRRIPFDQLPEPVQRFARQSFPEYAK